MHDLMKITNIVPAVGSDVTGDASQIAAFEQAPVLGAKFDSTITRVHTGGKRKKTARRKNKKVKKTRVNKKRVHRKKGYKKTLRKKVKKNKTVRRRRK